MKRHKYLDFFDGNWPTDKGYWVPGERVFYREKSLFEDFNESSWFSLLLYGISGTFPDPQFARIVELFWTIGTSFPDPRLWNNRVSALAGTTRSTAILGVTASTAISEAKVYGPQPLYLGSLFLRELDTLQGDDDAFESFIVSKLKKDRYLPGFGRPVIADDERIEPFLSQLNNLGFDKGKYQKIVDRVSGVLRRRRYRIKPNIAIWGAAVFADMGYTPYQSYLIVALTFSAGFVPCYLDSLEKPEGVLFPLDCESIEYLGKGKRKL